MTTGLADVLYEKGFYSADELASCSAEELSQVQDLSEVDVLSLIENAQTYVTNREKSAAVPDSKDLSQETSADEKAAHQGALPEGDTEKSDQENGTSISSDE
jgi:N utilization substance protein A